MKNARKYGYSEFPRAVVIPGGLVSVCGYRYEHMVYIYN